MEALSTFTAGNGPAPEYPPIQNSGFVASFEAKIADAGLTLDPGGIVQCFDAPLNFPC